MLLMILASSFFLINFWCVCMKIKTPDQIERMRETCRVSSIFHLILFFDSQPFVQFLVISSFLWNWFLIFLELFQDLLVFKSLLLDCKGGFGCSCSNDPSWCNNRWNWSSGSWGYCCCRFEWTFILLHVFVIVHLPGFTYLVSLYM